MKRKIIGRQITALLLIGMLLLSGCGSNSGQSQSGEIGESQSQGQQSGNDGNNEQGNVTESDPQSAAPAESVDTSDMFSNRDYKIEYDDNASGHIQLNGTSAAADNNAVQIIGTTVTITDEGTYVLTGTLEDGRIVVNADEKDKVQLVLNGVDITSETSAALYILEADKVFVTLAEGSANAMKNGGSFVAIDDNNIDGTVFSKQDLTFNGTGSLQVDSPAGHGIVGKDDLVFTGGMYTINSASHGLDANDSVRIDGAKLTITAGKDGVHVENSDDTTKGFVYIAEGMLDISGEGDGISAGAYMQIDGGEFHILTGGGSANGLKQSSDAWGGFMGGGMGGPGGGRGGDRGGNPGGGSGGDIPGMPGTSGGGSSSDNTSSNTSGSDDSSTSIKGLKAAGDLIINGGIFTIDSADDAVHSNTSVTVNGGTFTIATGDDGFHADDTLTITDGVIEITESYEGFEGLHILVSGGDSRMVTTDDGLNAAGGNDASGFGGDRGGDMFGRGGGFGAAGGMSSNSSGTIVIRGGKIYVKASGDGIDANGTLEISGGEVIVCGPTTGDTATLDYDISAVITGGTFMGTGGSMMAQTFSDSQQGVFAVSVGNVSAGTEIVLTDASGKVLISYTPELNFAVVILSSPEMVKGESYTITVGGQSGTFEAQ